MSYRKIPFSNIKELLGIIFNAPGPVDILPDSIHLAALASEIELEWNPCSWWDNFKHDLLSNQEILNRLFEEHKPAQGHVLIVTDECFKAKEGYILPVGELLDFTENVYPEIHKMEFFQPLDTIFIFPDDNVITIMSHEGHQMQHKWG